MINVSFLTQNTNLQNSLLSVCYRPTVLASLYKLVLTAHSHSDPRGGPHSLGAFCSPSEWDINFRYILNIWFLDDKGTSSYSIWIRRIGDPLKAAIRCSDRPHQRTKVKKRLHFINSLNPFLCINIFNTSPPAFLTPEIFITTRVTVQPSVP